MAYVDMVITELGLAELLRRMFSRWQSLRGVPRLLWWLRRLTFPPKPVLVKTPDDLPVVINREDYGQLMLYYFPYCRELQALLADVIKPGDICLDLGANVGLLTAHMVNCTGVNGKVIAVEPNPSVVDQLKSMTGHVFPDRVVVVSAGISARDGKGVLCGPVGGFSESMEVMQTTGEADTLELLSIDTLVYRYLRGYDPNFIKVDIEGNEVYLLEAMQGLLVQGCRPVLLIEFHPEKCESRGVKVSEVVEGFCALGYQVRRVNKLGDSYELDSVLHSEVGHENLLFMTEEQITSRPAFSEHWI